MGLREYIASAILVGLFLIALINFANYGALDNNGRNIMDMPSINKSFGSMTNSLTGFSQDTGTQLNATSTETPTTSFGSLVLNSIVGAGRVFTGSVLGVYNVINVFMIETLGIPSIVLNILLGIIIVSLIFFMWRAIRLGT
jgi:hypothetical protein